MKQFFYSSRAKALVDILLIIGLFGAGIGAKFGSQPREAMWSSLHCLTGLAWCFFLLIHAWQHWKFIGALTKKNVWRRNKITAATTLLSFLMFASMVLLALGSGTSFLKFHHVLGHLFVFVVIVHMVDKFKRLISILEKSVQK